MNEAFRRCASIAAALVPGGEETRAERAAIDQAAGLFDRIMAVVDLAVSDPAVPRALADSVRLAAVELVDWASEFAVLASSAASDRQLQARSPADRAGWARAAGEPLRTRTFA
jgi:hypothetical protein